MNLTSSLSAGGKKPYCIPAGASDHPLGGLEFARWALEVISQEEKTGTFFGNIIVCAVTGSTLVGMIAGFKLGDKNNTPNRRRIIGIDASAKPMETRVQVLKIAKFTAAKIGLSEDVVLDERFHALACMEYWIRRLRML
jgi:1-aminocyclopropane-1-carboxylate deaminase